MSMPSDIKLDYSGQFFDGQSAAAHNVTVRLSAATLLISGDSGTLADWSYDDLLAPDPVIARNPTRVTHASAPYARLIVDDTSFAGALLERAPQLSAAAARRGTAKIVGFCILGALAVIAGLYAFMSFAPQSMARIMPDAWRGNLGVQIEKMLVRSAKKCTGAEGVAALNKIDQRLRTATPEGETFRIAVYDLPIINAFALPGGKIVFSGKLIAKASGPDAVAGVMAHEMGHVIERHSEAQMVRVLGLTLAQELLFAGSSNIGGAATSLAGYLTILSYTRDAERQADDHAKAILEKAGVDSKGLITFFELIKSTTEDKTKSSTEAKTNDSSSGQGTSLFSTHPGLSERIEVLKNAPKWQSTPILTDAEWQALKAICS